MANYAFNPRCITPQMTSLTTPSPVVISSSSQYDANWAPWGAFTRSATDRSWSAGAGVPQWIKVDLGAGRRISGYDITGRHDGYPAYNASAWTLQGSNDDANWTDLHSTSGVYFETGATMASFAIPTLGRYRYFRLYVTACGTGSPCVGELQLLEVPAAWHLPFRGRPRMR